MYLDFKNQSHFSSGISKLEYQYNVMFYICCFLLCCWDTYLTNKMCLPTKGMSTISLRWPLQNLRKLVPRCLLMTGFGTSVSYLHHKIVWPMPSCEKNWFHFLRGWACWTLLSYWSTWPRLSLGDVHVPSRIYPRITTSKNNLVKSPTHSPSAGPASSAHDVAASNDRDAEDEATWFASKVFLASHEY